MTSNIACWRVPSVAHDEDHVNIGAGAGWQWLLQLRTCHSSRGCLHVKSVKNSVAGSGAGRGKERAHRAAAQRMNEQGKHNLAETNIQTNQKETKTDVNKEREGERVKKMGI